MAYSVDFREKAIEYWNKGHTKEELYEVFGIYPSRVNDWKRLLRETGALETQYRETRNRKISPVRLVPHPLKKCRIVGSVVYSNSTWNCYWPCPAVAA